MKYFICLIAILFISACGLTGRVHQKSVISIEAQDLLSTLKNKNSSLKAFKGIGKIRQWNKHGSQVIRVAWMGAGPGKLRIAALGVSGQPMATISSDGKWLYFVSHAKNRFKKMRSNDPNLRRIVSIPVKFSDVISLLSGGVPIRNYHSASVTRNKSGDGHVIVLRTRWNRILEKIYLDESKTRVYKIEIFNSDRSLAYQAEFDRIQNVKAYKIPFQLVFSNDNGEGFQLSVNRYWPDVYISPSKFVLNPPDH